jgi:aspartyl/glutamyl-tRNA(Asn/Gln) amidotransferase C subunit
MKITKEELKSLATSLYFELDDIELQKLYSESELLLTSLERLSYFEVDNLNPMHYPIENSHHSLREDEPIKTENPNEYLKNAKNRKGKYVVVK